MHSAGPTGRQRGRAYDPAEHAESITRIIETFTPAFFERVRGFAVETEQPVFIVGLPRSGTTLTEQILASHSKVHGAGELSVVRDAFESLPRIMKVDAPAVQCLGRLDRESAHRLTQYHLDHLRSLNRQALRIVDKMPENYIYLGLLTALYPGRQVPPLPARPERRRRLVLDDSLPARSLGQRSRSHRSRESMITNG